MQISGLYHLLALKTRQASAAKEVERLSTEPSEVHEAGQRAARFDQEGIDLAHHIVDDEGLINDIERIIARMQAATTITSAHRSLAFRDLENASMRLRRELGDEPE